MKRNARGPRVLLALLSLMLAPVPARAEASFSLYGGVAWIADSEVVVRQSGGTDITLHDVAWKTRSLESPGYWGARVLFWLPRLPEAGFGVDYTHNKAFTGNAQIVRAAGTRAGTVVDGWEPLGTTVRDLGFSHGLNIITLNMLRRWFVSGFRPYLGLGIGAALPHVEGTIGSVNGGGTRYGGLAFQAMAGASDPVGGPVAIFGEYKLQYAGIDVPFGAGTQLTTSLWIQQFTAGLTVSFGEETP